MRPYAVCKAIAEQVKVDQLWRAPNVATVVFGLGSARWHTAAQHVRTISRSSESNMSDVGTSQASVKPSDDQSSRVKRINLMTAVNEALAHSLEDRR